MVSLAEREREIEAIYVDIRVALLGKLMEQVNAIYVDNDLKELKRLQGRLVKIIQSFESNPLTRLDSEELTT